MHPIGFAEANKLLGKPPSMTSEECSGLEVFTDGKWCVSRWQLSDLDLAEINRNGGKIYISIVSGGTQPPIRPQVFSPFADDPNFTKKGT